MSCRCEQMLKLLHHYDDLKLLLKLASRIKLGARKRSAGPTAVLGRAEGWLRWDWFNPLQGGNSEASARVSSNGSNGVYCPRAPGTACGEPEGKRSWFWRWEAKLVVPPGRPLLPGSPGFGRCVSREGVPGAAEPPGQGRAPRPAGAVPSKRGRPAGGMPDGTQHGGAGPVPVNPS